MKLKKIILVLGLISPLLINNAFSRPLNKLIFGTKNFSGDKSNQVNYNISFNKDQALNHKLLMTTAGISVLPAPTGNALASKVVFFKKRGNSLYMFEVLDGKLSTDTLDTKKFLAEFPIVAEDETTLTIDFKKGMNNVFYKSGMYGSDSGRPSEESKIAITNSFIDRVEHRNKYLFIDQFIHYQIPGTKEAGDWRIKYTFSSYSKNENFKSKLSSKMKKVGYFESNPMLKLGEEDKEKANIVNILRFDPNKQATYYISSNVPKKFKQAVIDGVLYWNKAFGKEFLKVAELPKEISVHEPGYNIVQWMDWKTAGFAYANIQSDPLTGEILQTHVYMTSSFATGSVKQAKRILKKLLAKFPTENEDTATIGLKGFHSAQACNFQMNNSLAADAHIILKELEGRTDKESEIIIHRYVSDYIREVVAHEVGHTLGLRHNFAASTHTNISHDKWDELTKTYFLSGILPEGVYPTSSVMDYTPSFSAAMQGAGIRLGRDALAYDKKAIEWGYGEKHWEDMEFPLFCTDSHAGLEIFQDCKRWDYLVNPIIGKHKYWMESPSILAYALFTDLEEGLEKWKGKSISKILRKLKVSPKGYGNWLAQKLNDVVVAASPNATYWSLVEKFSYLGSIENEEYKEAVKDLQKNSFSKWGSVSQIIFKDIIPTNEKHEVPLIRLMKDEFHMYLDRLNLTQEQLAEIKPFYNKFFQYFEKEFILKVATYGQKWALNIADETLVDLMTKFSDKVLFSRSDEEMATSKDGNKIFKPYFEYKSGGVDLRKEVINFANTSFYPINPSYNRKKGKIKNVLIAKYLAEKERVMAKRKLGEVEDGVFDWYMFEAARFLPIMPKILRLGTMSEMTDYL